MIILIWLRLLSPGRRSFFVGFAGGACEYRTPDPDRRTFIEAPGSESVSGVSDRAVFNSSELRMIMGPSALQRQTGHGWSRGGRGSQTAQLDRREPASRPKLYVLNEADEEQVLYVCVQD